MVVDPGVVINPDRVRAQMEGAAVMGVGLAMFGEITATNGRIEQGNFDGFRVARMNDAPVQVNVHFAESGDLPTGVGEPGLPPVIAALGERDLRGDRQADPRDAVLEDQARVTPQRLS